MEYSLVQQAAQSRQRHQVMNLVENRTIYAQHGAELSIYDTYEAAENVRLDAEELLYCGMITGRKVLQGDRLSGKTFLPMESFVMSPGQTVAIDFPDAEQRKPTSCLAIHIDRKRVRSVCDHLNKQQPVAAIDDWQQFDLAFFHCLHSQATQGLLTRIVDSFTGNDADRDIVLELGITELLTRLLRSQGKQFLLQCAHDDPGQHGLSAVLHHIDQRLAETISVDELCQIACMSRSKLYDAFGKAMASSPMEYIQLRRLERACELLAAGQSVTQVSYTVGYANPSHFARRFQQRYGLTPSLYQQRMQ